MRTVQFRYFLSSEHAGGNRETTIGRNQPRNDCFAGPKPSLRRCAEVCIDPVLLTIGKIVVLANSGDISHDLNTVQFVGVYFIASDVDVGGTLPPVIFIRSIFVLSCPSIAPGL